MRFPMPTLIPSRSKGFCAAIVLAGLALPTLVAAAENPAINTSVACPSSKVMFMPMASQREKATAFVLKQPQAGKLEDTGGGTYVVDFGTPERVNALLADLNKNHRNEVIDMFQFLQCKY
jgi:hypothetical protein